MSEPSWTSGEIPQDRPNPARMYDYSLGGYHNFAVDRRAAEQVPATVSCEQDAGEKCAPSRGPHA